MKTCDFKSKKGIYILSLLAVLVLAGVFLNSFYWPEEMVTKRKLFVWLLAFVSVVILPIIAVKIEPFYNCIKSCVCGMENGVKNIKSNWRKISAVLLFVLVAAIGSALVTYVVSGVIMRAGYNMRLFYTMMALSVLVILLVFTWKTASEKPERIFLIVSLVMGIFCICVTPCRVGVSWDDEIHYERTLEISNYLNGITYLADDKNIMEYGDNIYARTGYDRESDVMYTEELEAMYEEGAWSLEEFNDYGVWSVGYIPSAIGIILGRGLGLSYAGVFNMGRFFNLLAYTVLICLAMKRVKYGKVLVAAIGLIPTTIFMASNYSYDPWVTGFVILGYAYFIAELQEEGPMSNRNLLIMLASLVLGCMPKATYFPMLFPLLFMPKRKFASKKQRRNYYLAIIGGGLFLVATFMLPILIGGAGTGDARGGSAVNATEQIKFILGNPLAYAKILVEFLLHYVSLGNAGAMLQKFAYVGDGYFYSTVSLTLAVLAFLDRGETEKNYVVVKGANLIGCTAAVVLSTTALYISFTAVAAETVAGMQGRYLVPTIYPALYALGLGGNKHKINKNAFVCVPMVLIALTFIVNMVKWCVIGY